VDQATPLFQPAIVINSVTGEAMPHPVRTSENAGFPWMSETPAIHALNRRMAAASGTKAEWGEPLQVLRYRPGQQYKPHFDGLAAEPNQRILTMLVYLNDGFSGGETLFVRTGLKVVGKRGDALLFRNADDQGNPDPISEHAGLPVTAGEKLIASRWIRQARFGPI
jgi:prolyl 4-hydroxylase